MKLLVCGGMGFIGSAFIRNHIAKNPNDEIINLDNLSTGSNIKNLERIEQTNYQFIEDDIQNTEVIDKIVSDTDVLVNFAAETHVDNSITDSTPFIHTNISGTHSLLNLLHNCEIDRYVQISTDEVYGSLEESSKPFTETSPIQPNSPYSASKASGDLLCRSFYETYGHPIIITRCSNNYGHSSCQY